MNPTDQLILEIANRLVAAGQKPSMRRIKEASPAELPNRDTIWRRARKLKESGYFPDFSPERRWAGLEPKVLEIAKRLDAQNVNPSIARIRSELGDDAPRANTTWKIIASLKLRGLFPDVARLENSARRAKKKAMLTAPAAPQAEAKATRPPSMFADDIKRSRHILQKLKDPTWLQPRTSHGETTGSNSPDRPADSTGPA